VAVRHNAIVETFSNAPKTFEPIFARKPNHDVDAGPWCEGFYAAMKLRLPAWAPLRNLTRRNAYKDIPAEEMRQYWMPMRFKTRS
jgi:uncharacterized protein